jgi:hypothetical protein
MLEQVDFYENADWRNYTIPYSSSHPIPPVQNYREHQSEIEDHSKGAQIDDNYESKLKQAAGAGKQIYIGKGSSAFSVDPYPTGNRNAQDIEKRKDCRLRPQ